MLLADYYKFYRLIIYILFERIPYDDVNKDIYQIFYLPFLYQMLILLHKENMIIFTESFCFEILLAKSFTNNLNSFTNAKNAWIYKIFFCLAFKIVKFIQF